MADPNAAALLANYGTCADHPYHVCGCTDEDRQKRRDLATAALDLVGELMARNQPDPDTCSFCHEHRPGDMGAHAGHTHVCADCLGEVQRG